MTAATYDRGLPHPNGWTLTMVSVLSSKFPFGRFTPLLHLDYFDTDASEVVLADP